MYTFGKSYSLEIQICLFNLKIFEMISKQPVRLAICLRSEEKNYNSFERFRVSHLPFHVKAYATVEKYFKPEEFSAFLH